MRLLWHSAYRRAISTTPSITRSAAIALGANLRSPAGEPAATIRSALAAMSNLPRTTLLRASTLHITRPVSTVPQPDFVNAAAILSTSLAPRELLDALLAIERAHGRTRPVARASTPPVDPAGIQAWDARPLDLDLILYADYVVQEPGLTIPHPRLHLRRFVLTPLAEIAPDMRVPQLDRTVRELLLAVPPE